MDTSGSSNPRISPPQTSFGSLKEVIMEEGPILYIEGDIYANEEIVEPKEDEN